MPTYKTTLVVYVKLCVGMFGIIGRYTYINAIRTARISIIFFYPRYKYITHGVKVASNLDRQRLRLLFFPFSYFWHSVQNHNVHNIRITQSRTTNPKTWIKTRKKRAKKV